jgi:hypothetical protein
VPLEPETLAARLTSIGFGGVTVDCRSNAFRFRASREN